MIYTLELASFMAKLKTRTLVEGRSASANEGYTT